MSDDEELNSLIWDLLRISEKYKGRKLESIYYDAESLCLRFVNYCCSISYLLKGTDSPVVKGNKFLDPGSINVLCRAAFETFLVSYYIYTEPENDEEFKLKYYVWLRRGLSTRIKNEPTQAHLKRQHNQAKRDFDVLGDRIKNNIFFKQFNGKIRKMILSGRDWRIPIRRFANYSYLSYSDIAVNAGLPADLARAHYDYLSDYSHSGSLSVDQVHFAKLEEHRRVICDSSINLLKIICPIMGANYDNVMSNAKEY
jgi:hypothetical protein